MHYFIFITFYLVQQEIQMHSVNFFLFLSRRKGVLLLGQYFIFMFWTWIDPCLLYTHKSLSAVKKYMGNCIVCLSSKRVILVCSFRDYLYISISSFYWIQSTLKSIFFWKLPMENHTWKLLITVSFLLICTLPLVELQMLPQNSQDRRIIHLTMKRYINKASQ